MDLSIEKITKIIELSDYEIKRHKPLPDLIHSFLQPKILFELHLRYRDTYTLLPELDLLIPENPISVPDICIYPKMKIDFSNDILFMKEMPLTTIEILTPPQTEEDMISKAKRYFAAGVKSCWIVLPIFKVVAVYSSPSQRQVFTEDMTLIDNVTGIELSLSEIFS